MVTIVPILRVKAQINYMVKLRIVNRFDWEIRRQVTANANRFFAYVGIGHSVRIWNGRC